MTADPFAIRAAPPRLLDFARTLLLPHDGGPQAGQVYRPNSHPAQREIIAAMSSGQWRQFVVLGPTQDGKTWASVIVPILYHAAYGHSDALALAMPSRLFLDRMWRTKIRPAFLGDLAGLMPADGPGAQGGLPQSIALTSGAVVHLLGAGTSNEATLAGVTARTVLISEADDFAAKRGGDADARRRIDMAFARADAFGADALRLIESTIKHDDPKRSVILAHYAASTRGRLQWPCPACRVWQAWDASISLKYDATDDTTAAATAACVCPRCVVVFTDAQRKAAALGAKLVMHGQRIEGLGPDAVLTGDAPRVGTWGIQWSAIDSPLRDLAPLCVLHRAATAARSELGDHARLRQLYRDHFVQVYVGDKAGLDDGIKPLTRDLLAARSALGWTDAVPDRDSGGLFSRHLAAPPGTAADPAARTARSDQVLCVDVQQDRIYWALIAGDANARTWDLAWGYEQSRANLTPLEPGELAELLDRLGRAMDSLGYAPSIKAVDTGDLGEDRSAHVAAELPDFLAGRAGDWVALRGVDRIPRQAETIVSDLIAWDESWRDGLGRWWINSPAARSLVHDAYRIPINRPGAAHLPRGLNSHDAYLKHLCALTKETNEKTHATVWKKHQARHDWLDCRAYATALLAAVRERARQPAASATGPVVRWA